MFPLPIFHCRAVRTLGALTAACLLAAGCALPLKHPGAQLDLPASWAELTPAVSTGLPAEPDWWRTFASTELEALIAESLSGSPDLAVATERVLQAEIAVRSAGASLFPTLDLDVSTGARNTRQDGNTTRTENSAAALAVSYEIDVWGSNIANWQGSKASLAATRFDYEATRLSLAAGVANAYWQVLSLRDRLAIARQNLEIAERLFAIVEARYRHGAASALDLSRQRSTVLSARDALVPLEVQERQSLRALALLVGRVPQDFEVAARGLEGLAVPEIAPVLPGELLVRRPDLAAAEARLAAADADIAVARAALFPLKLSIGLSSTLTSGEFALLGLGSPAHAAGLTISLMQALFDGGRLRGQVESSESQRRVLAENWRKAVLSALKEVDDALSIAERGRVQEITQREIRDETARALRLSEVRYKEGSDSLSTLLDAQRSLFSAEDQLVQQRAVRLGAAVDVYKALGGGWRVDEPAYRQTGSEPAS